MQIIDPQVVSGKRVLLRLDLDVPVENGEVMEDFRLKASIPTLTLCIQNALKVIVIGHLGRPAFAKALASKPEKVDPEFSLKPVWQWFLGNGFPQMTFNQDSLLNMLENLRFEPGEESLDVGFAKKLASLADVFVFEAFASYRPAVSTTVLPTLMPHFAGLRFAEEIRVLTGVRENPKKPFVAIMGGAKVEDKLSVIKILAQKADAVLVGGKLVSEIQNSKFKIQNNILVGKLTEDGFDITTETLEVWKPLLLGASMIVWNGPIGKFEDPKNDATKKIAEIILQSNASIIIGGGDTISALSQSGLLQKISKKAFISTGGGAMLKLLSDGTLPTIKAMFARSAG